MLQQKKMALISGLSLHAKQGIAAYHASIGKPAGSLGFTQVAGKRRDEVRKGYKEALKVRRTVPVVPCRTHPNPAVGACGLLGAPLHVALP